MSPKLPIDGGHLSRHAPALSAPPPCLSTPVPPHGRLSIQVRGSTFPLGCWMLLPQWCLTAEPCFLLYVASLVMWPNRRNRLFCKGSETFHAT